MALVRIFEAIVNGRASAADKEMDRRAKASAERDKQRINSMVEEANRRKR